MSNEGGPKKSKEAAPAEGAPAAPERALTASEKREKQEIIEGLRREWFEFVRGVQEAGLDRSDIPEEWDRAYAAYEEVHRAIRIYYSAVRPANIARSEERYQRALRTFLAERLKAETRAERMRAERDAAPQEAADRSAASPEEIKKEQLGDILARLQSSETTRAERAGLIQEFKRLMNEDGSEPAPPGTAVAVYAGEAAADHEEPFAASTEERADTGFEDAAWTERPDIIDAEFEDLPGGRQAPPEGEETIHRAMPVDGPIVMVNPVLTRIAMGAKKMSDKKLDPFKPFPAAPNIKSTAQPRPSAAPKAPKTKAKSKPMTRKSWFAIGGAAAMAAAVGGWFGFNSDSSDGKKQEEARKAPKPAAEDTVQDLKSTTPPTMRASDAPPPQSVRRPQAVRPETPPVPRPEADPIIARREEEAEIPPAPVEPEGLDMKSYRPGDANPG